MNRILVVNGPNLNLLGSREPDLYGTTTLAEIEQTLVELGARLGLQVTCMQSNHEGVLVDAVQASRSDGADGLLVNAGGLTHTSVCLRDALVACERPFVEVHLTNLAKRESFRQLSLLSDVALGVIAGFGPLGYSLGLRALAAHLHS